jgi:outer membrane protein OmpA-like peptidoglycan-associated protein
MGANKITIFLLMLLMSVSSINAQETADTAVNYNKLPEAYWPLESRVKEKNKDQYNAYIDGDTLFAPRERRQVGLGIAFGPAAVSGDVKSTAGWGASAFVRHNISYILSARYEFGFYRTFGQNYEPRMLTGDLLNPLKTIRNSAYNGTNGPNYANFNINQVFDNYKTDIVDFNASVILNLSNLLLMHRKQHRFNVYAHMGGGIMLYKTWVDAVDGNGNPYNYNLIGTQIEAFKADSERGTSVSPGERRDVRNYLYDNVYDGRPRNRDYETPGEGHTNEEQLFDRVTNFVLAGGLGVEYLVGKKKRVSIGLEHKITFTNDDLLDGVRWSDQGDLTRDFDTYHYVSGRATFFLGKSSKRTIPMWWDNPVASTLRKYEAPGDRFSDKDGDGVDDHYDKEDNTVAGAKVDASGKRLDSDGDGCPDDEDAEPFSSPLLPIVDCKNVYDFASKTCCDEKAALLATAPKKCTDIVLPTVSFNYDQYGLSKDSYAALEQIAKLMQECPDLKVVVSGITNTTKNVKYNEQLSWNRANASVEHLVEKYGISRDRFIVKYAGTNIQKEGTDFDKFQNNRVEFNFAEEGVTGSSNPPAPHPGYKAGKP